MKRIFKFFVSGNRIPYTNIVKKINALEEKYSKLSNDELMLEGSKVKSGVSSGNFDMEKILPDAFAIVRETAKRNLNQRHYDVQLIGGIAMFYGKIVEMKTGEGKTLAATAPVFLRALSGKGVHVITVNDYLAQRDAVWMGQIYYALGLSVACIVHENAFIYDPNWKITKEDAKDEDAERDEIGSFKVEKDYLRPISRKEAYEADITYGTNNEFGFDYLRDNLAYSTDKQVQRGHYFAVIDEIDSILIDEARTPLIISAPDQQSAEYYKLFAKIVANLKKEEDYEVDEKLKSATLTDSGVEKVQKMLNINNLYEAENMKLVHYLDESLKAKVLFYKDRQYVVKNGEIIIVDEFTGRLMPGRRYSGGLHQAIEAKEGVKVQEESKTYAQVTIQNYFKLYDIISGMTGTAKTSEEEFQKVYGLEVVEVPTNKPMIRKDWPDFIYKNMEAKYKAIIDDVKGRYEKGQPVLLGTTSIEENELLSKYLNKNGIKHEILNAKNHEREGEIIAQAGRFGAITLATNMAGRGVDIVLGGNPSDKKEAKKIKELGGLFVLGTQRNESIRVDNQLRGRAGRQGDPGETRFFLSLEDDLLRIFGGDRIKAIMTRFNLPEDQPINSKMIVKVINEAQKKVEGINFDIRKHLLEFDNVLDKQRKAVYRKRQNILEKIDLGKTKDVVLEIFTESVLNTFNTIKSSADKAGIYDNKVDWKEKFLEWLVNVNVFERGIDKLSDEDYLRLENNKLPQIFMDKIELLPDDKSIGLRILSAIDMFWIDHLDNLEALLEAVRIRAYGQKDPLVEYKRDGYNMFRGLIMNAQELAIKLIFADIVQESNIPKVTMISLDNAHINKKDDGGDIDTTKKKEKIGRNDPCWCGSGKKYKKCHGK